MTHDAIAEEFRQNGFVLIRGFYDVDTEVAPIQAAIRDIVLAVAGRHGVSVPASTPLEAMTTGYRTLIGHDRSWGAEIYDAVKQIPAFLRLVSSDKNDSIFRALRDNAIPGIAAGGFGIRIDNPSEDRFRSPWHQEFPAQLRSLDGVVFWTPLIAIAANMGPVEIAAGSHAEGIIPVYEENATAGRVGAYALRLDREEERLARYSRVAPLTQPGDLILMDFLTMHQSGENRSDRPRWSIQFRYFNFNEPLGQRIGWTGSFAANVDFRHIIPELAAPGYE
jgi:hypothetical protein